MSVSLSSPRAVEARAQDRPLPSPPAWVDEWVGAESTSRVREDGLSLDAWTGAAFTRISVSCAGIDALDAPAFERAVADAYRLVLRELDAASLHPLRLWAFVPRIHAAYGEVDRYMVFNAGRFATFAARLGGPQAFPRSVPTASAVGTHGVDFHLHCLASARPGTPVENPRQVPAYRYSRRFGPLPPCFARATLLSSEAGGSAHLLVGGTASIRGEDSMHAGDLEGQLAETFRNLAAVVAGAKPETGGDDAARLAAFREVRVYHRDPAAGPAVTAAARETFTGVSSLEVRHAELCRPELLVEIEGVAVLSPR
jgi:chorismate lyase / 3-hydroxybenzoate synthase